jgi:hypothetical protein
MSPSRSSPAHLRRVPIRLQGFSHIPSTRCFASRTLVDLRSPEPAPSNIGKEPERSRKGAAGGQRPWHGNLAVVKQPRWQGYLGIRWVHADDHHAAAGSQQAWPRLWGLSIRPAMRQNYRFWTVGIAQAADLARAPNGSGTSNMRRRFLPGVTAWARSVAAGAGQGVLVVRSRASSITSSPVSNSLP